jgi:trans-aconitate 2-methyltransferase
MAWDPDRYLRFGDLRTRPAAELLARVPHTSPSDVVDLGCGPGNSTVLLADRWPRARVLGIDNSEAMLRRARRDHPDLEFALGDVEVWAPDEPYDVVFANAVLQWVDDPIGVLRRMMQAVGGRGSLAVQVPNNFDGPSHTEAHRIVRESFPELDGILPDRSPFEPADWYDVLATADVAVDVWQVTYVQPLRGDHPVADWTSGTFLRPLLGSADVSPEVAGEFMDRYRAAMAASYPMRADGVTLLPFPRLFVVATRLG